MKSFVGRIFLVTLHFLSMLPTGFEFVQQLPTPSIQFGGKTGNNVTALIFKRLH
jgi:hypothetical protein